MSSQNQSNLQKQFCQNHPQELLTNFCSNVDCIKALCPECIESHSKYHQQVQTNAEIDSLKNVKYLCSKKVNGGILEIQKILEDAEKYGANDNEDQTIKEIRKGKENIINLVNQYFAQLEEQYRQYVEQQSNTQTIYQSLQENLRNTMNELEHFNVGLESSNLLQVIKKVCTFDLKRQLIKYRKTMKTLQNQSASSIKMIQLNPGCLQQVIQSVQYYANLNLVPLNQSALLNQSYMTTLQQDSYLQQNDYFRNKLKLLHFFQPGQSLLWLYDLTIPDSSWRSVVISNYIEILPYSKSIMAPDGSLYLSGGSLPQSKQKSTKIYQFNFSNYALVEIAQLTYGRSSHGFIWKNNELYFVGGYLDNLVITPFCEAFDCINKRIRRIPNLNTAVASPGISTYNDTILIAGGMISSLKANQSIEILYQDRWIQCQLQHQINCFASMMCAIQIDQHQLMIFGGYQENNKGLRDCAILEVHDNIAKLVELKQLPAAEGFWNNIPLIYQGKVYALQNITIDTTGDCAFDKRRILIFDGQTWK